MDHRESLPLNAWPSFADLMLSVVLVFVIVLATVVFVVNIPQEGPDFTVVEQSQEAIRLAIAAGEPNKFQRDEEFANDPERPGQRYEMALANGTLVIVEELLTQHLTFGGDVLFELEKALLSDAGRNLLTTVGESIATQVDQIREVQIHGHADLSSLSVYSKAEGHMNNLRLSSARAENVFEFLSGIEGLNPTAQLMSVVSYGDFVPVVRGVDGGRDDEPFTEDMLEAANDSEEKKQLNRRIEMQLTYYGPTANSNTP
jgi:outer membrane protein OmpA-like peptidoglycan-associated protein